MGVVGQMRGLHVGLIGVAAGLSSGAGVLGALAYQKIAVWNGTVRQQTHRRASGVLDHDAMPPR